MLAWTTDAARRAFAEREDYIQSLLQLANCLPYAYDDVDARFKAWLSTRPYSWRDGMNICLYRARLGIDPFTRDADLQTFAMSLRGSIAAREKQ